MEAAEATLVLGSSSIYRRAIMEDRFGAGGFEMDSPDIDEKAIRRDTPEEMVVAIAHAKADALVGRYAGRNVILICSDEVVRCAGRVLEKPRNNEEGKEFLRGYANAPAECVSSVVLVHVPSGRRLEGVDVSRVYFNPIPDAVIDEILAEGVVQLSCGSFAVLPVVHCPVNRAWCVRQIEQPLVAAHIDRIDGSSESVRGLPADLMIQLLGELGWKKSSK